MLPSHDIEETHVRELVDDKNSHCRTKDEIHDVLRSILVLIRHGYLLAS